MLDPVSDRQSKGGNLKEINASSSGSPTEGTWEGINTSSSGEAEPKLGGLRKGCWKLGL